MREILRPKEFDAHLEDRTLRLAFVGMSNTGKSYRARVLAEELGFAWYDVDKEILNALGMKDVGEISSWLGYPYHEGYAEREKRYLELESRFTEHAAMRSPGANLVFDTTGSVVHLPAETRDTLRENCLVVHLDVGEKALPEMIERFFAEPKPVAWNHFYQPRSNESPEKSLRHSYPGLLAARLTRYDELAHVTLPAAAVRDTSALKTLALIRAELAVLSFWP